MWFRHDGSACRCWVTVAKISAVLPGTRQDGRTLKDASPNQVAVR